jgi:serine/threonine-protein kinase
VLEERRAPVPCDGHAETVADRYHLGPVLRRSAGCCAHRGYDELLQRTVSVTLVAADPDAPTPFALGPRCWQDRGPEVAELYDAGSDGGHQFLVTQHPDEPTLAETTPPGGLDVFAVRELGTAVATALLPRHQHGAVHGGLGAGTVAWSPRGTSLAEFGLLPWLARWDAVPVAPPFPAPEQRAGAPSGPATDVYALGRLLGELAPEHGMRPALRDLLDDMTAESPAERPALDEVLRRLRTVSAGAPFRSAARVAGTTVRRHGRRVALVAAVCGVVGLGAALAAAGSAPAAPSATLAATAPAAAPPFALNIQMPRDASTSADPDTPSSADTGDTASPETPSVADAADRAPSGGSVGGSVGDQDAARASTPVADHHTSTDDTSAPSSRTPARTTDDTTQQADPETPVSHDRASGLGGFLASVPQHGRQGLVKPDGPKKDRTKPALASHHGATPKHDDDPLDLLAR